MSRTKSTKSTKKKAESTEKADKPESAERPSTILSERDSAAVLGEYLAVFEVADGEVAKIETPGAKLNHREIAIAFLVSEQLEIPPPVEFAPRFRDAYTLARHARGCLKRVESAAAPSEEGLEGLEEWEELGRRLREQAPHMVEPMKDLLRTIFLARTKAA